LPDLLFEAHYNLKCEWNYNWFNLFGALDWLHRKNYVAELFGYRCFNDPNDASNIFTILMSQCPYKCLKFTWYIVASMTLMMPWIYLWYWCLYDPTDALNLLVILMVQWSYWFLEFAYGTDASMTVMMPWIYLLYCCLGDLNDASNLLVILIPRWP
jgi:hypothetical protein